jgi:hypothetical protein
MNSGYIDGHRINHIKFKSIEGRREREKNKGKELNP